jgi:spore coat protein H
MKKTKRASSIALALCILLLMMTSACSPAEPAASKQESTLPGVESEKEPAVLFAENNGEITVQDKKLWYSDEDDFSVVTMYLTVREGNSGEGTNHTWDEVNSHSIFYYQDLGVDRYRVEGILQVGDEFGPAMGMLGYGAFSPNAIVQVRGNTTSTASQKSFKVELDRGKELWREQRTIILNKHIYDPVRFRNKLTYDLLKQMPGTISARSQFVRLFIKDQTGDNITNEEFVDYGLFTQVEQFNNRYLRNHGFDDGGHFYKAEMFEFYRYPDALRLDTDPQFDLSVFEKTLEVKGDTDHSKLIGMLEEINNILIPIEELFPKYFDEENYFTWMAFQILTGNIDTASRNFYLYSPLNSQKWYFIPWDNDGAWSTDEEDRQTDVPGHEMGISNYWGGVLHQRVLKTEKYRQMLNEKITEVRTFLNKERLTGMIENYSEAVYPLVYSPPDIGYARVTPEEFREITLAMPMVIEQNYEKYKESLSKPMPFFMGTPEITRDNQLKFNWGAAFDLDEERISYRFLLSDSYLFDNILFESDGLLLPGIETEMLPFGQYFYRVIATNESGYSQAGFDYYTDSNSVKHYGIIAFSIRPEGILLDRKTQSTTGG